MKIKIIKCSDSARWYKNIIGEVLEVKRYLGKDFGGDKTYEPVDDKYSGGVIDAEDIEIIEGKDTTSETDKYYGKKCEHCQYNPVCHCIYNSLKCKKKYKYG